MRRYALAALASSVCAAPALAQSCDDDNWLFTYRATIVDVYDGDTVKADVDLGFGVLLQAETFRLYGIDAPEVRGAERAAGLKARDWLRSRILGKRVTLKSIRDQKGKYGRRLALICDAEGDVIADLVAASHAERREY